MKYYTHKEMLGRMALRLKQRQASEDGKKLRDMLRKQHAIKKTFRQPLSADVNVSRDDLIEALMARIFEMDQSARDYRAVVRKRISGDRASRIKDMKDRNRAMQDFMRHSGVKPEDLKKLR
jgi:hypothetical protein